MSVNYNHENKDKKKNSRENTNDRFVEGDYEKGPSNIDEEVENSDNEHNR